MNPLAKKILLGIIYGIASAYGTLLLIALTLNWILK